MSESRYTLEEASALIGPLGKLILELRAAREVITDRELSAGLVGAAGAFGLGVYVVAQAAVNLKAAADQALIGTADAGVTALYYVVPHTITSPMIAELQARDAAGAAAPRVEINQNVVLVPAAGWGSVVWTLAWCVLMVALCASGLRRRPFR